MAGISRRAFHARAVPPIRAGWKIIGECGPELNSKIAKKPDASEENCSLRLPQRSKSTLYGCFCGQSKQRGVKISVLALNA
jgi:hypothetical protein